MRKRNWKRMLCALLSAAMVAGLVPVTVSAAEGGIISQQKTVNGDPYHTYYADGTAVEHYVGNKRTGGLAGCINVGSDYYTMTTLIFEEGFTIVDGVAGMGGNPEYLKPITVQLPESIVEIDRSLENGGANGYLESINFPSGLKRIGLRAFTNCVRLTEINLNDGLEIIEKGAFGGCDSLTSVTVPDSVTTMGEAVFSNCENLSFLTLPAGMTYVPGGVAANCPNLSRVTIPEGTTSVKSEAFLRTGLTNISLPSSLTTIGSYAFKESNLSSIQFGEGLESIGYEAFRKTQFTNIEFPDGLQKIGEAAFADTPLVSATIPASVTSIGKKAFPKGEQLTIYGYRGTAAQRFAESNGNIFVPLDDCGIDIEIKEEDVTHGTVKAGTVTELHRADGTNIFYDFLDPELTLISDNDTFHDIVLTVRLPEGFSFEPNELVTEREIPLEGKLYKDEERRATLPAIYPIYLGDLEKEDMYELEVDIRALDSVDVEAYGMRKCGFFDPDEVTHTATTRGPNLIGESYEFSLDSATGSGSGYNQDTAVLSALLADGAYDADGLNDFLTELGFSRVSGYNGGDFNIKNCGYYLARKRIIKDGEIKNLVYVMCRGTAGSGTEWLGNFQVGADSKHVGFNTAAAHVFWSIKGYCNALEFTPDNTIFLVTGHSKAAATANNVGNWLNNDATSPAKRENVSVYTFATPNVDRSVTTEAAGLSGNENIFNFVHYQDAIRNAPSMQYYGRYGHTTIFGYGEPPAGVQSVNFGYGNYECIGDAENYTIMEILNGVMNAIDPQGMSSGTLLGRYVLSAVYYILDYTQQLPEEFYNNRNGLYNYSKKLIDAVGASSIAHDGSAAHSMVEYYKAVRDGVSGVPFEAVQARTTAAYQYFLKNIDGCVELYAGPYSILHRFKCPIHIYVDDANGNTVLKMENGTISNDTDDLSAYYDGDARVIRIPYDQKENYTIRLVGYDNGTVTHCVTYCGVGDVQSVEIQHDIPIQNGETLTVSSDGYLTDPAQYTESNDPEQMDRVLLELENIPYTVPETPIEIGPSPEPAPEPTPGPTSEPTPEPSPEPIPEPAPEPTSEPEPSNTPEPQPVTTPEAPDDGGEEKGGGATAVIIILVVIVAAAACAYIVLKKKKKS